MTAPEFDSRSHLVPMRDGVRIALEVIGQPGALGGDPLPAIVVFTRYGRATRAGIASVPFSESLEFTRHGFVLVSVDVRGTGASFGRRTVEKGWNETRDQAEIFDWIVAQPWSDGRIATTGISYPGNAADLAQIHRHPALKAVAPRFTDFDLYEHLLFPGGIPNNVFPVAWAALTAALDRGEALDILPPAQPVDGDTDGSLLAAAIAEHGGNGDSAARFARTVFRDDSEPGVDGDRAVNLCAVVPQLRDGMVPSFHWASWLDAGTAAGALARFAALPGPMRVKIGAWNHGAMQDANPYTPADAPLTPSRADQIAKIAGFFHAALTGRVPERGVDYHVLGAECWRSTPVWPPAHLADRAFMLDADGALSDAAAPGIDDHAVDFDAGTGQSTRWTTQLGGPVDYPDRRDADARLLHYTTAPLVEAVEITGTPHIALRIAVDREDALFLAYLEHVAPDGRVTYLSEGGLRGLHHARRSFLRADASPLVPGAVTEIAFPLLPVSVAIPAGHRIRLSLAGADRDSFARLPADGPVHWRLHRGGPDGSRIVLPMAAWTAPLDSR